MVVKTGVLAAYDEFEQRLKEFVAEDERECVDVFESDPGILWANVGSEKFRNVPSTTRQEMIWEYLGKVLSKDARRYCWGVHCMDVSEYREALLRRNLGGHSYPRAGSGNDDD